jgi:hypothetical protein
MSGTVVQARNDLFLALQKYGVSPTTNGALTSFASNPAGYLTGEPLLSPAPPPPPPPTEAAPELVAVGSRFI